MESLQTLITILHVIGCVFLIIVVLLQSGRGGGMGAAFGGSAGAVFGGRGAGNFLTKLTTGMAIMFMVTAMTLSWMSSQQRSVVKAAQEQGKPTPPSDAPPMDADTAPVIDPPPPGQAPAEGATHVEGAEGAIPLPGAGPAEGAAPPAPAPAPAP